MTRAIIGISVFAAVLYAAHSKDLAAIYVALGVGLVVAVLHVIEVKVNRLLDHLGIVVRNEDLRD